MGDNCGKSDTDCTLDIIRTVLVFWGAIMTLRVCNGYMKNVSTLRRCLLGNVKMNCYGICNF